MESAQAPQTMIGRWLPVLYAVSLAFCLFVGSGCSRPRVAIATFQFEQGHPVESEAALRKLLGPMDPSVELRPIRNTQVFQIAVKKSNFSQAVEEANRIVNSIPEVLKEDYPDAKFKVWELAGDGGGH